MAFSFTWDASFKAQPSDAEGASLGASRIRDFKSAVTERMQVDHSWTGTADDGKHLQVTLPERASDPATVASTGSVYTKDVVGKTELFYVDDTGAVVQLTSAGSLLTITARSLTGKTTVASAATPDIFALANGYLIDYTGTATATGFAAAPAAGMSKRLYLAGAAAFTAGANLLIDGHTTGQTVTLAAGAVVDVFAITTTQFKLSYKLSGSATLSATGLTTVPTVTARYIYADGFVTVHIPQIGGTSNANSFTLTGMPAILAPAATQYGKFTPAIDNSAAVLANTIIFSGSSTITLGSGIGMGIWAAAGGKTLLETSITYRIS